MSHHSNKDPFAAIDFGGYDPDKLDQDVERTRLRRQLLDTVGFKGALGTFPDGKLSKNDEGALQFGMTVYDGKVCIDFGTPVRSLGMTPQQAADFASDLLKIAREAGRKAGETVGFTIR